MSYSMVNMRIQGYVVAALLALSVLLLGLAGRVAGSYDRGGGPSRMNLTPSLDETCPGEYAKLADKCGRLDNGGLILVQNERIAVLDELRRERDTASVKQSDYGEVLWLAKLEPNQLLVAGEESSYLVDVSPSQFHIIEVQRLQRLYYRKCSFLYRLIDACSVLEHPVFSKVTGNIYYSGVKRMGQTVSNVYVGGSLKELRTPAGRRATFIREVSRSRGDMIKDINGDCFLYDGQHFMAVECILGSPEVRTE